jgi:hypothetical protein
MLPAWWDWDISARARIVSLASAWVLVGFAWAPLAVLLPIGLVRFGASFVQTLWNHRLDRVQPLGPRGLLDWGMFVAAMVASIGVAALERGGSSIPLALALALVLAPLSVIQVRATRKSFAAHQRAREHVTLISDRVVERAGSRTAA